MANIKKNRTKPKRSESKTKLTLEEKFFQVVQNASYINENILKHSDNSLISKKSSALDSSKSLSESIIQNIDDINPLYVVIESNAILNHINNAAILDKVSYMKSSKDKKSNIDLESESSNRKELSAVRKDALRLIEEAREKVSERDMGSELSRYMNGLNYSEIISKELQFIGKELSKQQNDKSILTSVLGSISDKIENVLKKIPGMMRTSLDTISNKIKLMLNSLTTGAKEELIEMLRKIFDSLYEFINSLIGAFFSLLALIQKIASEKGFKLDKTTLEIEAFEISTFMVGPLPLLYPKIKTPKLTADFSST